MKKDLRMKILSWALVAALALGTGYFLWSGRAGGVQTLEADTVLFALGMKSVDIAPLKAAAEAAGLKTWVIGDAIQPGKVDQATRSAYLAGIEVGR